ncbi:MAG TPA: hypothetical protein VF223_23955 [Trebonia sp.]
MKRRGRLAAIVVALCAVLALPLLAVLGPQARAVTPQPAQARHVVVVGISGLTWNLVTQADAGELRRLAVAGSVGSLVDYAQEPLACPADGWLTLNSAARAQGPRPCASLPAVTPVGEGAKVPAMPQIIRDNERFHESPDWGLLGTIASCATAVGPGAALALAAPSGAVSSYAPSPAELSPPVLARCPLTVVDLGQIADSERGSVPAVDRQLAQIAAELPPSTLLLVTAPGAAAGAGQGQAPAGPPHLMSVLVSGPGFADGLLSSWATRRLGVVTLTDLTPTVAGWLGHPAPGGTVGAQISRADRGSLDSVVTGLIARDRAEQVWIATHGWFFVGYAVAATLAFGLPALLLGGAGQERRRRRAQCWRVAGVVAAAVPLASYLANLAPWWYWAHPAWWLYGMTVGWTLVVAAAALAGPWRRDVPGPFGAICAATVLLLAVDVIAGSRLQLDAPFGLSLLVSGRFYGIGNDALGVYCVSALVAAAWLASTIGGRTPQTSLPAHIVFWPCGPQGQRRSGPGGPRDASMSPVGPRAHTEVALGEPGADEGARRPGIAPRPDVARRPDASPPAQEASDSPTGIIRGIIDFIIPRRTVGALLAAAVGLLAVVASGWPGFGAKAGGTIALVPCLILLAAWLAGARVGRRWAVPVAVSGLVVFLAFAVVSYFLPATGVSDIGTFAGNLMHGRGGDLLQRKVSSNVGSLTLNVFSWLVPLAAALAAAALWRPAALRLRTLETAFTGLPLLRVLAWLTWLVLVIGWFADDSGVIVPAVALPFAVPLTIGMAAAAKIWLARSIAMDGSSF